MYWRPITTLFAVGRSTPAMRAILPNPPWINVLSLALLVPRIRRADHPDHTLAADHLALGANLLDRGANFHSALLPSCSPKAGPLLGPIGNSTPREIIRRQLHLHLVAGEDPNEVHPHLPGDVREDLVARTIQYHPKHRIR